MSYEVWGDNDDDWDRFEAARDAGWIDPVDVSKALMDVWNERDRQQNEEGWTPEHDDQHTKCEMTLAAACYASVAAYPDSLRRGYARQAPSGWPWDAAWWKPTDRRRDLVKAAALILAEIERLDRAANRTDQPQA